MRRLLALSLALLAAGAPTAQPTAGGAATPLYTGAERPPAQVSLSTLYQRVEGDGVELSQLSVPLGLFLPITRDLGFSLNAYYAASDGPDMAGVDGFADAQAALSYRVPVGAGSAVLSVGVNAPGGGAALTAEKAETAFLIGQGFYAFRLPTLGQGFNVAPGVTYAVPVGERVVLGVGALYQVRGPFEPRAEIDDAYDPGDEVLLTGGADVQIAPGASLALDVTYIGYGTDEWVGQSYQTGDAVAVTARWAQAVGPHEVVVLGRVRRKAETEVPPETAAFLAADAAVPTQGRVLASARLRLSPAVRLGVAAQGRYYDASDVFSEKALVDLLLTPEVAVSRGAALVGRLGGTLGDIQGLEAGAGVVVRF